MTANIKGLVKMLVIAYGMTAILLLAGALVMDRAHPSAGFMGGMVIVIYLAANFVGGLLTGRRVKEKRFLWGIGFGVVYFLVLFGVALILNHGKVDDMNHAVLAFFLCIIGGMSGGMLSRPE